MRQFSKLFFIKKFLNIAKISCQKKVSASNIINYLITIKSYLPVSWRTAKSMSGFNRKKIICWHMKNQEPNE